MNRAGKILYVEHSVIIGGSSVSLKEIITDAVSSGYQCSVACSNRLIAEMYEELGAKTYILPVASFTHNTGYFYKIGILDILRMIRIVPRTIVSFFRLRKIAKLIRPDLVHLNSSTLVAYTILFKWMGIPTLLHVRENVVSGYLGFRRWLIRSTANAMTSFVIYISEFEMDLLRTNPEKSRVIYNYVHVAAFTGTTKVDSTYPTGTLKLITLGGLFNLKGGKTLLEAMAYVGDNVQLNIVGSVDPRIEYERFEEIDTKEYVAATLQLLQYEHISKKINFFGKVKNPADYIGAADAVIFWAGAPHFPRTVFEAWIMKKPVIYFNPLFQNPIINQSNVSVVEEATPQALGKAINELRDKKIYSPAGREVGFQLAMENFTERNFIKINALYQETILKRNRISNA